MRPLTAKTLKFTFLLKDGKTSSQAVDGENKAWPPSTKLKFIYGGNKESLDAASIGLGQPELGSETVKSGVPLLFSVEITCQKGGLPSSPLRARFFL